MDKIYNFCAGPAMLPEAVMQQAQAEFCNWQGLGVSVMEVSHRGKEYIAMAAQAEQDLRDLLNIPDNYKVLFCQGGGRGQFAAAPLNLLGDKTSISFISTGQWSKGAVAEGEKHAEAKVFDAISTNAQGQVAVKPSKEWQYDEQSAYVHYCPNETIEGIAIDEIPEVGDMVLVGDFSSTILSQPIDVSKFGLIYAGAQKNIGPSGLAIAIIRDDLLDKAHQLTPNIFNYSLLAGSDSMFNTPPTYSWYLAGLVFKWLKSQGGLSAMAEKNAAKAELLYSFIDSSDFYQNNVAPENRSKMNIPFQLANSDLDAAFLSESAAAGLVTLKGHRIVGGMRASIYNAMPIEGVQALVSFMREFAKRNG
ncbi:3-phosphoserine/phosphohydroxythreonine transaminase [Agarivorans sp. 1_MG-2023]|uniref:3-phosphoserine/phosphohydroxythreonine transaminase n=1 Tax=Agarivorans sp. 1_MG-2023 TaxID=3062634 RepID=UPI0026E34D40|nr:3-phosphoserine/phosphohydroxythreonine transaminase [Agarivorans sp. 1_MG-2023]MDO6764734.1 3-phosphoserine/phosphohydroxythreonine transaminase [Agarivorans sp. 1_MG-2023]